MPDAPNPTDSQTSTANMDDSISKYSSTFHQNMAEQMKLYSATNDMNMEKNTMQSIMDVGMKAGKAVQT